MNFPKKTSGCTVICTINRGSTPHCWPRKMGSRVAGKRLLSSHDRIKQDIAQPYLLTPWDSVIAANPPLDPSFAHSTIIGGRTFDQLVQSTCGCMASCKKGREKDWFDSIWLTHQNRSGWWCQTPFAPISRLFLFESPCYCLRAHAVSGE